MIREYVPPPRSTYTTYSTGIQEYAAARRLHYSTIIQEEYAAWKLQTPVEQLPRRAASAAVEIAGGFFYFQALAVRLCSTRKASNVMSSGCHPQQAEPDLFRRFAARLPQWPRARAGPVAETPSLDTATRCTSPWARPDACPTISPLPRRCSRRVNCCYSL